MMPEEKLPIILFAKRENDQQRTEPGGSTEPPGWLLGEKELKVRSEKLADELENIVSAADKQLKANSLVPFVFKAKIADDATAKSRRTEISSMLSAGDDSNVFGMSNDGELLVKAMTSRDIRSMIGHVKNFSRNAKAISCLDSFHEYSPEVCEGGVVAKSYKLKLLDFGRYELDQAIERYFIKILNSMNIEFTKTRYSGNYNIFKLKKLPTITLDQLKFSDISNAIFSIEPMPKLRLSLDSIKAKKSIPIFLPQKGKRYETVGILDSGISNIKQFGQWLHSDVFSPYPQNEISNEHGTFVAGVMLYGDILEERDWTGPHGVKIFDATIVPDISQEGIDEDELVANIREAISQYHTQVRIWNLCVSIEEEVSDQAFSDFGIALDSIQEDFNVLICKSAGNCTNYINEGPTGRIFQGADSVRSIVVGSIAHEQRKDDLVPEGNPSPFSRIGPGPQYIIKPEVTHYGGNVGIDKNGESTITGVKSFSPNGDVCSDSGTSYSTPRVARIAASVLQELDGDFDPLLIKALLVHSASYPEALTIPNVERTKFLGFGVPKSANDILYNSPHEITLILQDSIGKGEYIDIMDFPMPSCLIHGGMYTGQVIATLVYNPILVPLQRREYCQSDIDVKFGSYDEKTERDIKQRHILNPVGRKNAKNLFNGSLYSKRRMKSSDGDFALKERLLIQYADKYYPVKKYAVDFEELTDTNKQNFLTPDKLWFLYVKGLFRDFVLQKYQRDSVPLSQDFCLILTIRDPKQKAQVYDEAISNLRKHNFIHSRIKLASHLNVTVDE